MRNLLWHSFIMGAVGATILTLCSCGGGRTAADPANVSTSANPSTNGTAGPAAVLTQHNNLSRSGLNPDETILTPANVNVSTFGKKHAYPVDGQIYGQPLYVPNVEINGASHNVVYVATEFDSVYAFDADGRSSAPLWHAILGQSVPHNVPDDIAPEKGITSTPVIDGATGTLYVVAFTTKLVHTLHALDIGTGQDKFPPADITPEVAGTGAGNNNGMLTISSDCFQRSGLALANGRIYVAFGHCAHGWIVVYDTSLNFVTVLNTSPNGQGAAMWMGGAAPAVDADGNLYFITGVDFGDTALGTGGTDFPDSFLKLSPDLQVLDSFTPSDESYLRANDGDLGSGGPILLPDNNSSTPHEIVGAGKDGRIFLLDRDSLGQFHSVDQALQEVQTGTQQWDNIWMAPAFFNNTVYYHDEQDVLRAYSWSNGKLSTASVGAGTVVYGIHGASPSISSNGSKNGIVWEVEDTQYLNNAPAVLHAYSAANVGDELYNSAQAGSRDTAGNACKFSVPTIADGKVFVPTSNELDIYGLL